MAKKRAIGDANDGGSGGGGGGETDDDDDDLWKKMSFGYCLSVYRFPNGDYLALPLFTTTTSQVTFIFVFFPSGEDRRLPLFCVQTVNGNDFSDF